MRKMIFSNDEYYHVFNRGVDKRQIFLNEDDVTRFLQSMKEFNVVEPIGSIYENSFRNSLGGSTAKSDKEDRLVEFVGYCLNPNHYHFILRQISDRGIEKFMHRLGGYTWFFNKKYSRSGSLFQGRYKAVHIDSNEQLLHTSVYVNLNDKVHSLGGSTAKWVRSGWGEYVYDENHNGNHREKDTKSGFCNTEIILSQFKDRDAYKSFAEDALSIIRENKEKMELMEE